VLRHITKKYACPCCEQHVVKAQKPKQPIGKSTAGTAAGANLYSLIETAKANDLEPYAYSKHVYTQLPQAKGLSDIEALLPWYVKSVVA
jgi:transposase